MYTYHLAIQSLKVELKNLGIEITEIADLKYESKEQYLKALPVLMNWLPKIQEESAKEEIVRTLSMPWAKLKASKVLINEFKKNPKESLSWAIGNGISITATNSDLDDLISIAENKNYGRGRQMVVVALGGLKNDLSEKALIRLLEDEEVAGHAIIALGKLKSKKALSEIKKFLNHQKSWVRNEALKAIKKIESSPS